MILLAAALLTIGVLAFVLLLRAKDLPAPEPVSPTRYLEEKKERIYEGLRDLQFEFRVGKLSEEDYRRTKLDLQQELARVLAEIDQAPPPRAEAPPPDPNQCPHCGARFTESLKFCGACGKPMREEPA